MKKVWLPLLAACLGSFLYGSQESVQTTLEEFSQSPSSVTPEQVCDWHSKVKALKKNVGSFTLNESGDTAFHVFIRAKNTKALEALLQKTSIFSCKNKEGQTPLKLAQCLHNESLKELSSTSSSQINRSIVTTLLNFKLMYCTFGCLTDGSRCDVLKNFVSNSICQKLLSNFYTLYPIATEPNNSFGKFLETCDPKKYPNIDRVLEILTPITDIRAKKTEKALRSFLNSEGVHSLDKIKALFTAYPINVNYIRFNKSYIGMLLDLDSTLPHRDELLVLVEPHRKLEPAYHSELNTLGLSPGDPFYHSIITALSQNAPAKNDQIKLFVQELDNAEQDYKDSIGPIASLELRLNKGGSDDDLTLPTKLQEFIQWLSPRLFPQRDSVYQALFKETTQNVGTADHHEQQDREQIEALLHACVDNDELSPLVGEAYKNFKAHYPNKTIDINSIVHTKINSIPISIGDYFDTTRTPQLNNIKELFTKDRVAIKPAFDKASQKKSTQDKQELNESQTSLKGVKIILGAFLVGVCLGAYRYYSAQKKSSQTLEAETTTF